jgi:hypothetical protein
MVGRRRGDEKPERPTELAPTRGTADTPGILHPPRQNRDRSFSNGYGQIIRQYIDATADGQEIDVNKIMPCPAYRF